MNSQSKQLSSIISVVQTDDAKDQYPSGLAAMLRENIRLSLPLGTGRIFRMVASIVNNIFIAKYNDDARQASFLILQTQLFSLTFLQPLGVINIYGSEALSRGSTADIGRYVQQGCSYSLIISVPVALFLLFGYQPVLAKIGVNAAISKAAADYFSGFALLMPILGIARSASAALLIGERRYLLMALQILTAGLRVAGAYAVYRHRLGISAFAVAEALVFIVISATSYLALYSRQTFHNYSIFRLHPLAQSWQALKTFFTPGIKLNLQSIFETAFKFIVAVQASRFGYQQAMILNVIGQLMVFYMPLQQSILQVLRRQVSVYNTRYEEVLLASADLSSSIVALTDLKRTHYAGLLLNFTASLAAGLSFIPLSRVVANFFDLKEACYPDSYHQLTHQVVPTAIATIAVESVRTAVGSTLAATKHFSPPMHVTFWLILLAGSSLCYLLGSAAGLDAFGLQLGELIVTFFATIMLSGVLKRNFKQKSPLSISILQHSSTRYHSLTTPRATGLGANASIYPNSLRSIASSPGS